MGVTCKNLKEFTATLQRVEKATKKPAANLVNKALKNVSFRAMQFTHYAEPGLIQAELYRDKILLKLATIKLKGRAGKARVDKFGNNKLTKSGRAQKYGKRVTRNQISIEAGKILKRRLSGARAIRAGWIIPVKMFGGSIRGEKLRPGSTASKSTAEKATISKLRGLISNALITRDHSGKRTPVENLSQATSGLNRAVQFVSKDMNDHQNKKEIAAVLRKFSDKK